MNKSIFKKIPIVILTVFSFYLFSCSNGEDTENIDVKDLMGEYGEDTLNIDLISEEVEELDTLRMTQKLYVKMQEVYDSSTLNKKQPFDRFGYSQFEKLLFTGKNEVPYGKTSKVIPKAEVFVYHFSDTLKLKNAFYNWLDCFGGDCTPVKLNEDMDAIKMPPLFSLVYDTTIVIIDYKCEHIKNDWKSFQDSLISITGKNYKHRIEVGCGGPLKWK